MDFNSLEDIKLKDIVENETHQKFNKQNFIKCPFHPDKTASFSVKFNSNANKYKFKCFGCEEGGDAIDFIIKYKNTSYVEARKYLGLSVENTEIETYIEMIEKYINWELTKYRKDQILLGLFPFVDRDNKPVYFKAKFKLPDETKQLSYYHIENDKVINNRYSEELPYNLFKVMEAIKNKDTIIVTEGEKDANTINNILKSSKYVATSVKGVKDLSILNDALIYVCGDTGEAGKKYIDEIKEKLFKQSGVFKIINLPGIEHLGDNKDCTDWLEAGHTRTDLLQAFKRSLDLKSKYELQQDWGGIYKTKIKEESETKIYLTNFNIISASNIKFVDENKEGVKLVLKSSLGTIIERTEEVTVFDDLKSFRNFLGSMDLIFKGKIDDLMDLKIWIKKYFAILDEEIYTGSSFIYTNELVGLITRKCIITSDKIDNKVKAKGGPDINITSIEATKKEELQELRKHIFGFAEQNKSYSIIGTLINNLAIAQGIKEGIKFHILLIAGGSGSGKSTILENVISAILNYPKDDIKSIGLITKFALINTLSDGNYSILFEEHKPSAMDQYRIAMLSEILRNNYDMHTVDRGSKNLSDNKVFYLLRPIIMAGEERYSNLETALMERSCIIYLSQNERTKEQEEAMVWIKDHKIILNKLGKSLIEEVLNLSIDEYKQIRNEAAIKIKKLKDRPLNTCVNICAGLEILNRVFKRNNIETVKDYHKLIADNISIEILDNKNGAYTEVEKVLKFYNDMIEDGRVYDDEKAIKHKDGQVFIRTSEMFNQINQHIKTIGIKKPMMEIGDFKKQAKAAGYLLKPSEKSFSLKNKTTKFDLYNLKKLKELEVDSIAPANMIETEWVEKEQQVIFPEQFNKISLPK